MNNYFQFLFLILSTTIFDFGLSVVDDNDPPLEVSWVRENLLGNIFNSHSESCGLAVVGSRLEGRGFDPRPMLDGRGVKAMVNDCWCLVIFLDASND